ncbi:MAG TPA: sarcosine oxidase subunit delta [Segeticoccus sp.]|jgi:heterotetrameric sarcosine oxidase delta subunit|nr:sarcosine oxidase subunit delta [Segeticoccus sp.]
MMLLPCPWCGPRDAAEFAYDGELGDPVAPGPASPDRWRDHLYLRDNPAGWTIERWFHRMGCRRWITVERHTITNEVRDARDCATGRGPS